MMARTSLVLTALFALAACSSTTPDDGSDDWLTEPFARAATEVPQFGGVAFDGARPVVFTLGDRAAATPAARALLGDEVVVRERAPRGQGSEALKGAATRLLLGSVRDVQSTDYDETTGYVRVGVLTASAVREAHRVMAAAGFPTSEVIVEVEGRIVLDIALDWDVGASAAEPAAVGRPGARALLLSPAAGVYVARPTVPPVAPGG